MKKVTWVSCGALEILSLIKKGEEYLRKVKGGVKE